MAASVEVGDLVRVAKHQGQVTRVIVSGPTTYVEMNLDGHLTMFTFQKAGGRKTLRVKALRRKYQK